MRAGQGRAGQLSIRINDQWRVCFRWEQKQTGLRTASASRAP